ncbi:MAG: hypothetical protein WDM90_18355 [Ferruginibacter sp.]
MKFVKLRHILVLAIMQCMFLQHGIAQYKTYKISEKGDTINAIDNKGLKQGKWVIHVDELRGEPGYEEEGLFKNDKKEGIWRQYNLTSDLIAVENYKLGGKDGIQQYYTYLGELYREESWRGYNPDAPYDTIPIYGTGSNEIVDYKIVKAEQYSVKHGEWKYYEAGRLIKSEKYDRGFLEKPGQTADVPKVAPEKKKVEKTPEMLEWEKKNKGKKNALRDGKTGT